MAFGGDQAMDGVVFAIDRKFGGDAGEGDGVAEGISSPVRLAAWNGGDASDAQNVALWPSRRGSVRGRRLP